MTHPPQPIPFHVPFQGDELKHVAAAIGAGQFGSRGPSSVWTTDTLRRLTDVDRILLTNSCTAALELAALTLGIGPGAEVIVPSYTFASTANAFLRAGATVRFADIDPDTLCISAETVEQVLTPATRAVVPVHYAGLPGDVASLRELCTASDLWLIEDAAQAIGVRSEGRHLGTFGHVGAISFHHTKNVHCGFGGMFLAADEVVDFERATFIWERGTDRSRLLKGLSDRYTWRQVGGSFELGELAASFLHGQLLHLATITSTRAALFGAYVSGLHELVDRELVRLLRPGPTVDWNYHAAVAVFASGELAEAARVALLGQQISAYIGYVPLHSSPQGRRLGVETTELQFTESLAPRILRLPIHTEMSVTDVYRVCRHVVEAIEP